MSENKNLSKNMLEALKFNDQGLIPCIVQDSNTNVVLMMAWMDEEAIKRTLDSGTTWFYSRSRKTYWNKGETSGNRQLVIEIKYDCDGDVLLAKVDQKGNGACHTGEYSCFYRTLFTKAAES